MLEGTFDVLELPLDMGCLVWGESNGIDHVNNMLEHWTFFHVRLYILYGCLVVGHEQVPGFELGSFSASVNFKLRSHTHSSQVDFPEREMELSLLCPLISCCCLGCLTSGGISSSTLDESFFATLCGWQVGLAISSSSSLSLLSSIRNGLQFIVL